MPPRAETSRRSLRIRLRVLSAVSVRSSPMEVRPQSESSSAVSEVCVPRPERFRPGLLLSSSVCSAVKRETFSRLVTFLARGVHKGVRRLVFAVAELDAVDLLGGRHGAVRQLFLERVHAGAGEGRGSR